MNFSSNNPSRDKSPGNNLSRRESPSGKSPSGKSSSSESSSGNPFGNDGSGRSISGNSGISPAGSDWLEGCSSCGESSVCDGCPTCGVAVTSRDFTSKQSIQKVVDAVTGATWGTRNRIMENLFQEDLQAGVAGLPPFSPPGSTMRRRGYIDESKQHT